jgi:drug/metabolite transporter (DMT)-like permease
VPSSVRRQGLLALVIVIVAWGLTWPVNKVVLATLSPLWAVTLRSAIAAIALFALTAWRGRVTLPPRQDLPVLLSITLLHMVGFNLLTSWGLGLVPTGRTVVLAYTTPLWVTPGAALFLREPLTARRAVGVLIGLAGLATLFNPLALDWSDRDVVLGNLAILAGALLWALSILHIRAHRWASTPFALIPWETLLATVLLVPIALTTAPPAPGDWTPSFIALLLYLGIVGTAVAYWATATASRNLPAVTTSLGLLATPVVSVITATVWLGEPLTLTLVIAIVLVLGAWPLAAPAARRLDRPPGPDSLSPRGRLPYDPRRPRPDEAGAVSRARGEPGRGARPRARDGPGAARGRPLRERLERPPDPRPHRLDRVELSAADRHRPHPARAGGAGAAHPHDEGRQ